MDLWVSPWLAHTTPSIKIQKSTNKELVWIIKIENKEEIEEERNKIKDVACLQY